jgi:hypothetical protein
MWKNGYKLHILWNNSFNQAKYHLILCVLDTVFILLFDIAIWIWKQ